MLHMMVMPLAAVKNSLHVFKRLFRKGLGTVSFSPLFRNIAIMGLKY